MRAAVLSKNEMSLSMMMMTTGLVAISGCYMAISPPVTAVTALRGLRMAEYDPTLSRRERRAMYWDAKVPPAQELQQPLLPHPLEELVEWHHREERRFASTPLQQGERVMVLVIESSPLGLGVEVVPGGDGGLVYNDEAGFVPDSSHEPVGVGDVVPAWVLKTRYDDRVDFAFREPGAKPKLEGGAAALLEALLASRERGEGGVLPLGDASTPAEIKLGTGMSKSTFKAARGALLKAGALAFPLEPRSTALAETAAADTDEGVARLFEALGAQKEAGGGPRGGAARAADSWFEMAQLPPPVLRSAAGAAALVELIERYGDEADGEGVASLRVAPSAGAVRVHMHSAAAAAAAAARLADLHPGPPFVRTADQARRMSGGGSAPSAANDVRRAERRGGGASVAAPPASLAAPSFCCYVGNLAREVNEVSEPSEAPSASPH